MTSDINLQKAKQESVAVMPQTPIADGAKAVHCAITLKVRPGMEAEFENRLIRFVQQSLDYRGTTGVHLIRPAPGTDNREYGILRSFLSEEHSRDFYASAMFKQYKTDTADLVEGDAVIRPLHGLELFFRNGHSTPPRWKMAVVTWLAVFPAVLFWSYLVGSRLTMLHPIAVTAIVSLLVVITLAWVAMPWLTRRLQTWLQHGTNQRSA